MPGMLTFDNVRNKLLVHEHRVPKCRNSGSIIQSAFVSTVVSSHDTGSHSQQLGSNFGHGKNNRNNRGKNNKNNRGNTSTTKNTTQTTSTTGCNSAASLSHIQCATASVTKSLTTGNDTFEGVLGLGPNIICQICHSPGHNAIVCSLCYQPRQSAALPAMATAKASETLWYRDSAATSHMTPDEGMLSAKTPYSGSVQVEDGNGHFLPIAHIGNLSIQTHSRPLKLNLVLHVLYLGHNLLSVRRLCRENNYHVQFSDSTFCVKDNTTGEVLF